MTGNGAFKQFEENIGLISELFCMILRKFEALGLTHDDAFLATKIVMGYFIDKATHWMPMPQPPKGE